MQTETTLQGSKTFPGVILAGGLSSRMGENKANVRLGGMTLIDRAIRRLGPQVSTLSISANEPLSLNCQSPVPIFSDLDDSRSGPLAGILAALLHTRVHHPNATHVATVPTDSPFFPLDLVACLSAVIDHPDRTAVAASSGGLHPVFGLWPVALADELDEWLRGGRSLRLRAWLDGHSTRQVHFSDRQTPRGPFDPFFNINTPDDLAVAEGWLEALEP
ncbi:molybdenum cofactor guanylyltransferase MobA [Mycoplana ramosa]|uniref:Molybdenum cofactor guanylyltransferase n=1 Tax=Mycoplana ramosa TaxID=40837 RepID=A0ABW3YTZ3_MYCRA